MVPDTAPPQDSSANPLRARNSEARTCFRRSPISHLHLAPFIFPLSTSMTGNLHKEGGGGGGDDDGLESPAADHGSEKSSLLSGSGEDRALPSPSPSSSSQASGSGSGSRYPRSRGVPLRLDTSPSSPAIVSPGIAAARTTMAVQERLVGASPRRTGDASTVSWKDLPRKDQLIVITLARLSEPLVQTSLQVPSCLRRPIWPFAERLSRLPRR